MNRTMYDMKRNVLLGQKSSTAAPVIMLWDATDPNPVIHPTGFPDFDYFKKLKVVSLLDNGTEEGTLADYYNPTIDPYDAENAAGQIMVKFPKLYYKEHYNENNWLTGFENSSTPKAGLELHPLFTWGDGRDNIYVGAYEASEIGGVLASRPNQSVRTNINLAAFRDRATLRGQGWHTHSYWNEHLMNMLFYVYYGNLDSQQVLPGYTNASGGNSAYMRPTGRSNILTAMNGSVDVDHTGSDSDLVGIVSTGNKIANRFCFVENVFGHVWKFLDGVAFDGRIGQRKTAWMTNDPRIFTSSGASILSTYTDMDIDLLSVDATSYVKATGKSLLPVEGGAGTTTYYSDLIWNFLSDAANRNYLRVVTASGSFNSAALAGIACRNLRYFLSTVDSTIGSRLCFSQN